ncbi:hypothetical protein D0T84_16220 [Dysgonomonas sp. 521]|uniref:hypothetical protein n=1 Tax=Dysgonomonas sp. 521 TaxID=2302932 RepID=UPI0013D5D764|nr:hypothetical protein [Dysgonomonas sp. 521]NDV96447.1 hypothetical protein [Dysgonomonas sp. 521]
MKYVYLFLFCFLALIACKSTKKNTISDTYIASNTDTQKSKYESLYYSLIDSIRNIPAPKEKSESKGLQHSELETSLARSIAFLDSLGLLHHMIENKDSIPQPVREIIDRRYIHDTLYVHKADSIYVNKEVYIHEELSFWEKIRRTAGDIAIGLLIIVLGIFTVKQFIKK